MSSAHFSTGLLIFIFLLILKNYLHVKYISPLSIDIYYKYMVSPILDCYGFNTSQIILIFSQDQEPQG